MLDKVYPQVAGLRYEHCNFLPHQFVIQSKQKKLKVMKNIILITATLFFCGSLIAQTETENFVELQEFTRIAIGEDFVVTLIQSDNTGMSKSDNAEVAVIDGTLNIKGTQEYRRSRNIRGQRTPERLTIYFNSLEELQLTGAVDVRMAENTQISGERLTLNLMGATSARLNVMYDEIVSNVAGASHLTLSGTANVHTVGVIGASSLRAENLETLRSDVNIAGASNARINTQNATGAVVGASSLTLNPEAENNVSRVGASSVRQGGEMVATRAFDTPRINVETTPRRRSKKLNHVYRSFDFGFNGYGQGFFQHILPAGYENMELSQHSSFVINVTPLENTFRLGQSNFGVGAGLGMGWNIYRFLESEMIPSTNRTDRMFVIEPYAGAEVRDFGKSNLRSSWIRIPVFLAYKDKGFTVTAGVVGNVRMGASSKQVFTLEGSNRKNRHVNKDSFYLNGFRTDAELRVAYKGLGAFATYGLTNMFLNNRGPELTQYSFGMFFKLGW